MTKLNVFSKELTATEVKMMSDAGLGSDIEETYGLVRRIRWEDILLLPRTGNVAEIDVPVSTFKNLGKLRKKYRIFRYNLVIILLQICYRLFNR